MPAASSSIINEVPLSTDLAFKAISPRAHQTPDIPSAANNGCVKFSAPEASSHNGSSACPGRGLAVHDRTHSETSAASNEGSVASSSGNSTEFIVTPPDGGWGWVVVFAAFVTNMIADGVTFSFGVLYVSFLDYFKESKSKTAWVGSLFMAIPLLTGPIASTLTDRFGCRKVTIAGGLLASAGFILSSFANSLEMLFFTFGIMSGFGLALCYVAAIVIVAYYFEKRRSFATGLSLCGSGIGTFLFAPFVQYLVDQYSWRGATLILAGCFLHIVLCGALMRDLEGTTKKARSDKSLKTSTESISQKSQPTPDELRRLLQNGGGANGNVTSTSSIPEDLKDCERLCNSLVQLPTFLKQGEHLPKELIEKMGRQGVNYEYFLENFPHLLVNHSTSEHFLGVTANSEFPNNNTLLSPSSGCGDTQGAVSADRTLNPHLCDSPHMKHKGQTTRRLSAAYFHNLRLHRRSMTHRNAMLNVHRYHIRASSCPDIYRNSMITIAQEEENEMCSFMDDLKEALLDMVDVSYFRNVKFLIFCISNLLLYIWYDVPYIYMTDNAKEMGIHEDASFLISLIGILNTLGELIFGYVGDKPWVSSMLLYGSSTAVCGVVIGFVPLIHDFTGLAFVAGIFGLTISANYALTSIIVVDLITLENFTNAYGLLLLVQGIANLTGPPLAGWFHDITGSYDLSFYMAGLWIFIAGAIMLVLPLWRWFQRRASCNQQADLQSDAPEGKGGTQAATNGRLDDGTARQSLEGHRKLRYQDEEDERLAAKEIEEEKKSVEKPANFPEENKDETPKETVL